MLNPNRRLKKLWEKDYVATTDIEGKIIHRHNGGRVLAPELRDKPMYVRCILLIPKNLVYVFLLIICLSFAAMTYITYTETNLKEFVKWGKLQRQEFEVHDLYR